MYVLPRVPDRPVPADPTTASGTVHPGRQPSRTGRPEIRQAPIH